MRSSRLGRIEEDDTNGDGQSRYANTLAFPQSLLRYVSPQQMEFLACSEEVDVSVVRAEARSRVIRVLGPRARLANESSRNVFRMPLHTFMILRMHFRTEMRLLTPEYMNPDGMKALIDAEKDDPDRLQLLPRDHFYFFSYILVHHGIVPEPFDANKFLRQLGKLYNLRMKKLVTGLSRNNGDGLVCTNIADMELFALRRRFTLFSEMTTPSVISSYDISQPHSSSATDSFMFGASV